MSIKSVAMLFFLSVAAGTDLCNGKIYNKWTAAGSFWGLLLSCRTPDSLTGSLLGGILPVALLMVFFSIGVLGGGDLKLLAMTGCYTGIPGILSCMLAAFGIGAAVSLAKLLWRGSFLKRLQVLKEYIKNTALSRRFLAYPQEGHEQKEAALHFSVPVMVGVWCYLEGIF